MARVLLTGATGQDGSYLLDDLLALEHDVSVVVRGEDERARLETRAGVTVHVADLGDVARLPDLVDEIEPELIYNLGGFSSVGASWEYPTTAGLVSGVAVSAMLEGLERVRSRTALEPRFLQASTSEIFGAAPAPQTEATPLAPTNPYGVAKAFAHQSVRNARSRGVFASSVILYNHESPRRPASFVTRKITQGAARIAAGLETELRLGNLDAKRDWGWAPDYVEAMQRVLLADRPDDFIVATGVSHTVRDFVREAFAATGISDWEKHVVVDERFFRPVDAEETRGDASKIARTLGWIPSTGFQDIVSAMVREDLRLAAA